MICLLDYPHISVISYILYHYRVFKCSLKLVSILTYSSDTTGTVTTQINTHIYIYIYIYKLPVIKHPRQDLQRADSQESCSSLWIVHSKEFRCENDFKQSQSIV